MSAPPTAWRISERDAKALDELGDRLGEAASEPLQLQVNGSQVEVDHTNARTVIISVARSVPSRRPRITLTRETKLDRDEKAQGLLRELQLGDAKFDALVFVESSADDAQVAQALSRDQARLAARRLIQTGATSIVLEGAHVAVTLTLRDGMNADTLVTMIDGALELSRPGASAAPRGKGWVGTELQGLAVSLVVATGVAAWLSTTTFPTGPVLPLLGGIVGLGVGFVIGRILEGRLSASSTVGGVVLIGLAISGALSGVATLQVINGQGTEQLREVHGVALEDASRGIGKDRVRPIDVRWSDGSVTTERAHSTTRRGDRLTRIVRKGLLGIEWYDQNF
ncbi:MAG: hypothetical protein GQE15_03390 [Archangiaceae bacterium]|nr:hypothetical protein [Archangiaceae bacterium]